MIRNINPFLALVALVNDDNIHYNITNKHYAQAEGETTTKRVQYNSKDVNNEDYKDSNDEDSDEEDQESFYFYDCIGCKNKFKDKADLYKHIANCHCRLL